jgi:hypothetical protein
VELSWAKRFRAGDLEGIFEISIEGVGLWIEVIALRIFFPLLSANIIFFFNFNHNKKAK